MRLFSTVFTSFSPIRLTFPVALLSIATVLSGCSDDGGGSGSSSITNVEGWVGAQSFNSAQVVVNQVAESGQVGTSTDGIYFGVRESTDDEGGFNAAIANDEIIMFIARGQVANVDKDLNNLATSRQCQVFSGCTVSGASYSFGSFYPATSGFEWRSVIYTASEGATNNVNPITTLAAAFAYEYDVSAFANSAFNNQTFTAYDVVLANSQVSKLFGLGDIIGVTPANLTKLNRLNTNTTAVQQQIKYGALLAAIQAKELQENQLQENQPGNSDFFKNVVDQFVENEGQFYFKQDTPATNDLTLSGLYQAALDNLAPIADGITNSQAKAAAQAVIADFNQLIATANDDSKLNVKTQVAPDSIDGLLSATEVAAFNLGLLKTKAFIDDLIDQQDSFWQEGYKAQLDQYTDFLKSVRDDQQANLEALATDFGLIQDYYVHCFAAESLSTQCLDARFDNIKSRYADNYNATSKILTLTDNNGQTETVTVSQRIADLNLQDSIVPAQSNAIDVLITGTLRKNDLVVKLNHKLDSLGDTIDVPSAMRVYFTKPVSSVEGAVAQGLEIQGFELIWGDFELYDESKINDANEELELSGSFRVFYRGVEDLQGGNSELRFNIEEWVLTSTISDKVDDDNNTDSETTTLVVTGTSSNPSDFYPAQKFSGFDAFFTANSNPSATLGSTEAGLLSYSLGIETVQLGSRLVEVETADFINSKGTDIRYRFYPDVLVEDSFDTDGDGDFREMVTQHKIEECVLDEINSEVISCGPQSRVFASRDRLNTLNDLWKLGVIQRFSVPGLGEYVVDFPVKVDGSCQVLDLTNTSGVLDGRLIEPMVLGLDTVRMYAEINLKDDNQQSLPRTLLDMSIVAPTSSKYRVSGNLSHNYSGTLSDDSGLILGSGSEVSVMAFSYDTSRDFENLGNVSVARAGVDLTLTDSSLGNGSLALTEDQDITGFLTQTYNPEDITYTIIEDENGQPERCIKPTDSADSGSSFENIDKNSADEKTVYYLNYRDVVYATMRLNSGTTNTYTINYIDGSTKENVVFDMQFMTLNNAFFSEFFGSGAI